MRRVLLVVLAAVIAWRISALGISAYYLELAEKGDARAADKLLSWDARKSKALVQRALVILGEKGPVQASVLLKRAYRENPTAVYPLLALAEIAEDRGDHRQAAALVARAFELMPVNPAIQREIGNYWASRGGLGMALRHWSRVLEVDTAASSELLPLLLRFAEEPRTRGFFKPLAADPPVWWERFFRETAARALDLETVQTLFAYRGAAGAAPISLRERESYIRRLRKEGKIAEAHLVWIDGLDEKQRAQLGFLNNGGFDLEPGNFGFDWHISVPDRVTIATTSTIGKDGGKALLLVFRRMEKRFQHVFQPLFLDPGNYRIRGMVRLENLNSQWGLKWVVGCLFPESAHLGASERFLGSTRWRNFAFEVEIPQDCTEQVIRLVSAGERDFEYKLSGRVWFDDMSIQKLRP